MVWIHTMYSYMNSYDLNSLYCVVYEFDEFDEFDEFISKYSYMDSWNMKPYMNSIYEFVTGYSSTVFAKCLSTLILQMISSSSGTTNCLKAYILPFMMPNPDIECWQFIYEFIYEPFFAFIDNEKLTRPMQSRLRFMHPFRSSISDCALFTCTLTVSP